MAGEALRPRGNGRRRSILDLAPLELECLKTLWPLGQGTVRQIQQGLAASRPRAYTTIMTIMDRLAQKGVVSRHKAGRAYLYRPNLSAQQARAHAVEQLVESFFSGSAEALTQHLASRGGALRVHDGSALLAEVSLPAAESAPAAPHASPRVVNEAEERPASAPPGALDTSLL